MVSARPVGPPEPESAVAIAEPEAAPAIAEPVIAAVFAGPDSEPEIVTVTAVAVEPQFTVIPDRREAASIADITGNGPRRRLSARTSAVLVAAGAVAAWRLRRR